MKTLPPSGMVSMLAKAVKKERPGWYVEDEMNDLPAPRKTLMWSTGMGGPNVSFSATHTELEAVSDQEAWLAKTTAAIVAEMDARV